MKRRTNAVSGWVNFPIHDTQWKDTREGGMVVKLVVVDTTKTGFSRCSGGYVVDVLSESLINDNRRPFPKDPEGEGLEAILRYEGDKERWESFHFPNLHAQVELGIERYHSRAYLAALVLGTTGWSGWSDARDEYWYCRYEDLTEQGKALYHLVQALYPGGELHLLTFLDT